MAKVDAKHPGMYTHEQTAKVLSVLVGVILLGVGLLRLGWITSNIQHPRLHTRRSPST